MNLLKNTALLITLVFSFNSLHAEVKIAYVDLAIVMNESPESKAAQKNLNKNLLQEILKLNLAQKS